MRPVIPSLDTKLAVHYIEVFVVRIAHLCSEVEGIKIKCKI